MNAELFGLLLAKIGELTEAVNGVGAMLEEVRDRQVTAKDTWAGQVVLAMLPNATCTKSELARAAFEVAAAMETWKHVDMEKFEELERERNLAVLKAKQKAGEKAEAFANAGRAAVEGEVEGGASSWDELDAAAETVEKTRPGVGNAVGDLAYGVSPIEEQPVWDREDDHK